MAKGASSPIQQLIRRVVVDRRVRCCADPELLERFLELQDEAAFEALVRRHGPLVLGVCRGVLANEADAEDAFQATFLILARKAGSVRKAASLASWLHGVAYRTACRARTSLARRKRHEASLPPGKQPSEQSDSLAWREVCQVVQEELIALSERHRAPLVLCYLEGKTQDQAAALLGVAKSTLKLRLERGRALLRARLMRRGLGPAAIVVTAAWPLAGQANLPTSIVISTVNAATALAAGGATASVLSAKVAALVKGGLNAMIFAKMKIAIAILFGIGAFGAGAVGLMGPQLRAVAGPSQAQPADQGAAQTAAAQKAAEEKAKAEKLLDSFRIAAAQQAQKVGAGAQKEKPGKSDDEALRGAWTAVSGEARGKPLPAAAVQDYRMAFADGKVTVRMAGASKEGKYKLDPAAKPKSIDMELDGGAALGIYAREGETLKLCVTESGKEDRPTEFATKEVGLSVLLILKRADDAKPAAGAKEDAAKQDELPQVAVLNEKVKAIEAAYGILKEAFRRSREEIDGVLTKVDPEKNIVSFSLRRTKLMVDAVPIAADAKFLVGDQEVSIEEIKKGMAVSLQVRTEGERTVVTVIKAAKEAGK